MRHLYIILALFFFTNCKNNLEVNRKLSDRIEILDKDYRLYVSSFEQKYVQNEFKIGPFYKRAFYINKLIDTLIIEINNTNTFEKSTYIKMNDCLDTILSFYWSSDKDEYLSMYEKTLVFMNDYKKGEKFKSKLFLQYDLKLIRNEIIRYLYSQIDKYDYKFNLIRPIVLADKKELKVGETYKAKIMLSAVDTASPPQFFVFGEEIETVDGYGILNIATHKKGQFEWTGIMKVQNLETGILEEIPVSGVYIVK